MGQQWRELKGNTILSFVSLGCKLTTNIVVLILLARYLEPKEYGLFSYAFSISTIFAIIVDYGFNIQVVKYISDHRDDCQKYIITVFILKLFLAITSVIVLTSIGLMANYDISTWKILYLLIMGSVCNSYANFIGNIYRAINKFKVDAVTSIVSSSILLFLIICTGIYSSNVLDISKVYFISRLIYLFMNATLLLHDNLLFAHVPSFKYIKQIITESLPYGMHAFFGVLYFNVDTIIIKEYLTLSEVASYQAVTRIIMATVFLAEVLSSSFYPELAKYNKNNNESYKNIIKYYQILSLGLSITICIVILIVPRQILYLLYGVTYSYNDSVLRILAFSVPLKYLGYYYGTLLTVNNMQFVRQNVAVMASILVIVLNIIMLKYWGLVAAASINVSVNAFVFAAYFKSYIACDNYHK